MEQRGSRKISEGSASLYRFSENSSQAYAPAPGRARDDVALVDTFGKVIEALPEQIALVDKRWKILAVNPAWTMTAALYGYDALGLGSNYLHFCESKAAEGHSAAAITVGGIQEIESGARDSFQFIYYGRERWEGFTFQLCINRLQVAGCRYATITRFDVTELIGLRRLRHKVSDMLIEARATERRRVARDVHDSTMQTLTALSLTMGQLKRPCHAEARVNIVSEMEGLLEEAQRELRSLAYLAHPPLLKEFGFIEAVRALAEGYGRRAGLRLSFEVDAAPGTDWRPSEVVLYRVVQEALSNIHRHAKATQILIRLVSRRGFQHAVVADNGLGMSPGFQRGVGLASMRGRLQEHGGRITIRPGFPGTTLIASVQPHYHLKAAGDLRLLE